MKIKCYGCKNIDLVIEYGKCPYCNDEGYIKHLKDSDELLISCDEELNTLYSKGSIATVGKDKYVIYGFSGSEVEE